MAKSKKLDWSKLLGFDQLARSKKVGEKLTLKHSGLAKVGNKPTVSPR